MKKSTMKKWTALVMTATLVLGSLVGCGSSDSASSGDADSLNIMVWEGTWSEEMFTDFTDETGIEVNISYIDNTDTLLSKLIEGSVDYDLIDLESAYVKSFADNGLLAEIDHSKVENEKYIADAYKAQGPVGDEDLKYTVPDMAPGYTSIIYNKETCPIEITSFEDLADPALEGQVAMVNSTISLYGAALVSLGYSADSTDEAQIAEANDLLLDIKKNVKAFVGESAVSQLENGECSVAFCWDYSTLCNDSEENWDKFEMVSLDDGCEYFQQYWAIPSSSKKVDEATQLINFITAPEEYAKSLAEYGGVPMETEEALADYLPEGYYDNPSIAKYEEVYDASWKIAVNDEQIDIMDTYYTELMGSE